MLTSLYIQNLAVIEKVTIEFGPGMNLFTGETGAGKSIVIDAIHSITGGRCSKELVRTGAPKAVIIGTFQNLPAAAAEVAEKYGWELDDELIVQRDIAADGKTTARVNGLPVTVAALRELGRILINIHGQHDNQMLLDPSTHLGILDSFGELGGLRESYRQHYTALRHIENELAQIRGEQEQKEQKLAEIAEQIEEIDQADVEPGEDAELENEARAIKNSARILESIAAAHNALSGNEEEDGAVGQLTQAVSSLENAAEYYGELEKSAARLQELAYEVQEIARGVGDQLDGLDFNPDQLDAIEFRLDELFKLKRKFGVTTIEELLAVRERLAQQQAQVEMYDVRIGELMVGQKTEKQQADQLAKALTDGRIAAAKAFVKRVSSELAFLDMQGVVLDVRITPCTPTASGRETVELLLSTNIGEPPKPIAKIASGGELSRIMLSIKNTLADKDAVPTLIFDEVDTGVSGSAAQKIGLKLKQASRHRQILCVTHLAQIAAQADVHFKIQKGVKENRTCTQVNTLDAEGRVNEVARIMSAGSITDLTRQAAREMIAAAEAAGRRER